MTLAERYSQALQAYDLAPTARAQKNALAKLRKIEDEMTETRKDSSEAAHKA